MIRTITISGVIVFDTQERKHTFVHYLTPKSFQDGVFTLTKDCQYIFVCEHTITAAEPEGLDLVTPQLKALDEQEKAAGAAYAAVKTQIEARRQSLLALECDPQVL